jgi:hypothetical protein
MVAPCRILVVGFWLSAMANFLKDGGATAPYSIVVVLHVGRYGGFLALRHGFIINNTYVSSFSSFMLA